MYLNRGNNPEKKKLYKLLVNLPFVEYRSDYEADWKLIQESEFVSEELSTFLEYRHQIREKWVKCFMKQYFTCGTCTSSRIESKHRVYKTYLNGNSRLCEVFQTFKELEENAVSNYADEIEKINKSQEDELRKHVLIKEIENRYSYYVVQKMKTILLESIHYSVEETKQNQQWLI